MTQQTISRTPIPLSDLTKEDWLSLISEAGIIGFDTEATGLNPYDGTDHVTGFSISFSTDLGMVSEYFPIAHETGPNLAEQDWRDIMAAVLAKPVVLHNAIYDLTNIHNLGYRCERFYCTMKLDHLINENQFSYELDFTTERWLGYKGKERSPLFKAALFAYGWKGMPSGIMHDYAKTDAELPLKTLTVMIGHKEFTPALAKYWKEIEAPTTLVLASMRRMGVRVNTDICKREELIGTQRMKELREELDTPNLGPKFLQRVFYDELGLPIILNKKTGKPTFDKDAMKRYELMLERKANDNPIANRVLEYRGWQKAVSSYYLPYQEKLSKDGRLRAGYKPHGTVTGRFSCSDPNLQQIPKETDKAWNKHVKGCLIGADGYNLWEFDYSQLEFRLAASASKEGRLIEIFDDPIRDIFTEMAGHLAMARQDTKTLTYTILYGGGIQRLQDVFGYDEIEADDALENFFGQYPMLRKARQYYGINAKRDGYVDIWSGRRRHFKKPKEEHYKAFNSFIQGGAADIVKVVMVDTFREVCNDECRLLLQVHDSLVFEIAEGREDYYIPLIKEIMRRPQFGVRLDVDSHKWSHQEAA